MKKEKGRSILGKPISVMKVCIFQKKKLLFYHFLLKPWCLNVQSCVIIDEIFSDARAEQ